VLLFWHEGNVGNVRHGFEVAPALEHTRPQIQTVSYKIHILKILKSYK